MGVAKMPARDFDFALFRLHPTESFTAACLSLASLLASGCSTDAGEPQLASAQAASCATDTPVGLALEVDNGTGQPVRVRAGQTFYVNQLDLRASLDATTDEGISGLSHAGDFASLAWSSVHLQDQDFLILANPDGSFTRRRFYRGAGWMTRASSFTLRQIDAHGHATAPAVVLQAGEEDKRAASDDFFVRRMRAIQWTSDCHVRFDCTGASAFQEEALVELRNSMHDSKTFVIRPDTAAFTLTWSLRPGHPYTLPVAQVAAPSYAYGFQIDVAPVTPPGPDGSYEPGAAIDFEVTLRDGAGQPLHPPGQLPTYNDVVFGPNQAGVQYYRAFFDATITYYRRKHRERMMMAQIIGPTSDIQPIRSFNELESFLTPDDVQTTGLPERDGVFAQVHMFPTAHDLFGGAFDPAHAGWAAPVPATWTFTVPENAAPGTYLVTVKGRRVYLGEDIPATRTIEIQVGTPTPTTANLSTGPCTTCHTGASSLGKLLHGNANRAACNGCHAPLSFEHDAPISVRVHFIHSRSGRFGAPLDRCSKCHLSEASIQRTSKSACLSCHTSYPASHVAQFGPIESPFVGGGRESFDVCTNACHQTHPHDGF